MAIQFGGTGKSSVRKKVKPNLVNQKNDPLADVEYTGDLEKDAAAELNAMQVAYRERNQRETDRFKQATDSEYWVAVCFQSREDKEKFLKEFALQTLGDKYLDGGKVAKRLRKMLERG